MMKWFVFCVILLTGCVQSYAGTAASCKKKKSKTDTHQLLPSIEQTNTISWILNADDFDGDEDEEDDSLSVKWDNKDDEKGSFIFSPTGREKRIPQIIRPIFFQKECCGFSLQHYPPPR